MRSAWFVAMSWTKLILCCVMPDIITKNHLVESRFQSGIERDVRNDHIVLTTHNEKARNINIVELNRLPGQVFTYKATAEGDFPSTSFPGDDLLELKPGAHVMFIKNDSDKSKRY